MNACGARGVWTSAPFLALGRGNRGTSLAGNRPGVPVHQRCPRLASPQKEGEFTLHGRAILEMEQYIRETYPDAVKVCNICRGLLIQVPGARRGALSRTHSGPRPRTSPTGRQWVSPQKHLTTSAWGPACPPWSFCSVPGSFFFPQNRSQKFSVGPILSWQ